MSPKLEDKIIKTKRIVLSDSKENIDHDLINNNDIGIDYVERITFNPLKSNNNDFFFVDKIEKTNFLNLIEKMKDKKIKSNSHPSKGNLTDRDID